MIYSLDEWLSAGKPLDSILCADCLDVLPYIEDGSVDLVLTDPPYGVNLNYDLYNDTNDNWEKLFLQFIPHFKRLAQMSILPSCQIKKMNFIYENHPPDWLICWYKGSPGHSSYIGFNDWEPHLVYGKKKRLSMHDFFYAQPTPFKNGHPCPKPIEWATWLLFRASSKNDIVLDPFLGSGTTAVACKMLNRRYIGIEISMDYCLIAEERLSKVTGGHTPKIDEREWF
jgi:DNA modification methylase